jgi:hypothetical protein
MSDRKRSFAQVMFPLVSNSTTAWERQTAFHAALQYPSLGRWSAELCELLTNMDWLLTAASTGIQPV